MKNLLLGYPSDWFVEPEVLEAVKESLPQVKEFSEAKGEVEAFHTPLRSHISEPLKEVYTIPFLTDKYCSILCDEIENTPFKVNEEEDELRQIPEIVLAERLPMAHAALAHVVQTILNPVFWELWQVHISKIHIQVANYNLRDKRAGAWHHDRSADITVVVPLNTGKYEGGGTEFFNRGEVSPLPTGTALIFPSFTHMHRGLPVISGNRYLLVFWLKVDYETQTNGE